tara:strand:+ start:169 stop:471 length:303 start_codon:yes stop_codon:yes gene_type:complete
MYVHSVFFYLKKELTNEQRIAFKGGCDSLATSENVSQSFVGVPAVLERSVVDGSYDFSLTFIFNSKIEHDKYQVEPIHHAFIKEFESYWERVQVYDAVDG